MKKKQFNKRNFVSQAGATMLELILAMTLVAIGSAVVYPNLDNKKQYNQDKQAAEGLKSVANAIRVYENNFPAVDWVSFDWDDLRDELKAKGLFNFNSLPTNYCYKKEPADRNLIAQKKVKGKLCTDVGGIEIRLNNEVTYTVEADRSGDTIIIPGQPDRVRQANPDLF